MEKNWFDTQDIWDEELMNSQEWLMHFIQLCKGVKIKKIYENLSFARVHDNNMSHTINKNGDYYYHQCLARKKAMNLAKMYNIKNRKVYKSIARDFCWFFLFIIYKGAPLKGLRFFGNYISYLRFYFV